MLLFALSKYQPITIEKIHSKCYHRCVAHTFAKYCFESICNQ